MSAMVKSWRSRMVILETVDCLLWGKNESSGQGGLEVTARKQEEASTYLSCCCALFNVSYEMDAELPSLNRTTSTEGAPRPAQRSTFGHEVEDFVAHRLH